MGTPHFVRVDNVREFVVHDAADRGRFNSTDSLFIDPGSAWQSAWITSFDGRLGDELLNVWRFDSLLGACAISKTGGPTFSSTLPREEAPTSHRRHFCEGCSV